MKILWKLRFLAVTTLLLVMLSSTASAIDVKTLVITATPDQCPIIIGENFHAVIELNQAVTGTIIVTLGSGATWSGPISGTSVTTGDLSSLFPAADTMTVTLRDASQTLMSIHYYPLTSCPWPGPFVIYRDP
jgi:hypothetical protein